MKKFLNKLITLLELMIGLTLLLAGITSFFSYILFNIIVGAMGFFILVDGLEKIDDPKNNEQTNTNDNDDDEHNNHHKHWGHKNEEI